MATSSDDEPPPSSLVVRSAPCVASQHLHLSKPHLRLRERVEAAELRAALDAMASTTSNAASTDARLSELLEQLRLIRRVQPRS
jgi:hypothetical protein